MMRRRLHTASHSGGGPRTSGHVIHWARRYDLLTAVLFMGKERRFREEVLDLAGLVPGERVLDVGCGTGTLAIAAARRLGPEGAVHGVDPAPEMVELARAKAREAGVTVHLRTGVIEELPHDDESFDVVTSTLMFHHLTGELRERGLREIRRVLRPGGRVLVVDLEPGTGLLRHLVDHVSRSHRSVATPAEVAAAMDRAGFAASSGPTSVGILGHALGHKPSAAT